MACIADPGKRRAAGRSMLAGAVLVSGMATFGIDETRAGCCCAPCTPAVQEAKGTILARIQLAETNISQAIGAAAEKIHYTIRDQTTAQQEMINGLADTIVEQLERQKAYDARAKVQEAYGNPPITVCLDANGAAAVVEGDTARQEADQARDQAIGEWMRDPETQVSEKILDGSGLDPEADLDVENLLMQPVTGEGAEKKEELVRRMIDFTPPKALDEDQMATTQGIVYQSKLNERRMRLEPAASVIRDRASRTDPAYPMGEWLKTMLSETGYGETPAGKAALTQAKENDGRISYDLKLKMQVRSRSVDSLSYLQRIESMQGADLERELIKQMAINNQIAYDRLRLEQRMALMEASREARRIDRETKQTLDRLRLGATKAKASGSGTGSATP